METYRVPQHVQVLQRVQDVVGRHGGQGADLVDVDIARPALVCQDVDDGLGPVGAVAQQAQVAQRFLGAAELPLPLAQLVAEGDEQLPVSVALELGQRQDARDVVALGRLLLLAEVTHEVAAVLVAGGHAVEEERVDVVVERLVVEEQLRQEAQVAAPPPLPLAVDLEEGDVIVAVDLVAGGVQQGALGAVALELLQRGGVGEAELADVDHVGVGVRTGVGAEVPGLHLVFAHLDPLQVPDAGDLGLVLRHAATGPQLFNFFLAAVRALVGCRACGFGCSGGILDIDQVEVAVFGFGRAGGDFGGDDGDGVVAPRSLVLLTPDQGGSCRFRLSIAG